MLYDQPMSTIPSISGHILRDCLGLRVQRLNREVTRLYDAHARQHGMTAARINVMAAIAANPGIQARDLVEPLSLEKSTLSRNLGRLERDGLVRTKPKGRGQLLHLTANGKRKMQALYPSWQAAQSQAEDLLGELRGPLMEYGD